MSKNKETRTYNISVVGLSGTEKEKGSCGVGKSCLSNRFIRPKADDYHTEHTSILSQIDFSGRVVNNDHYLYWGRTTRTTDEGQEYIFNVVEQTEFIDDATFQPHRSSNPQHYIKRAAATKLTSAEKLMYICTDQLGIEQDFDQHPMPDGKLHIDGFLVCFDVSVSTQRILEDQWRFLEKLVSQLVKSKKPILLVATKCDRLDEQYIKELQAFASGKKVNLPVVETSANDNVNVSAAFLTLAQMIDKLKGKPKLVQFVEAAKQVKEHHQSAIKNYNSRLTKIVTDYHITWQVTSKLLDDYPEYVQLVDLLGANRAESYFREHIQRLKAAHIEGKIAQYISSLPNAFDSLIPDITDIEFLSWDEALLLLQKKPEFGLWFVELSDGVWTESSHINAVTDRRIPVEFLREFGPSHFQAHVQKLQVLRKKEEMKGVFCNMLENSSEVLPGRPWEDAQSFFIDKECSQMLCEQERISIYQECQGKIIDKIKDEYQELLLEHSETFADVDRNEAFNHDKIAEIYQDLEHDSRYKALKWVSAERDALILKHIFFVHHPTRESCFSKDKCTDLQIPLLLSNTIPKLISKSSESLINFNNADTFNVIIFGRDGLASKLGSEIKQQSTGNEFTVNGKVYELELKAMDGDVTGFANIMQSNVFQPSGCLCVFNSLESLNYIMDSLGRVNSCASFIKKDGLLSCIPVTLMLANQKDVTNRKLPLLRQQAQQAANKLQVSFIDCPSEMSSPKQFHETQIKHALSQIINACQNTTLLPDPFSSPESGVPDVNITMCLMCGDPFNIDTVLMPFLEFCSSGHSTDNDCINLEMSLGMQNKKMKVSVISYHAAMLKREELIHGYILVYSAKRKASFAMLRAFLSDVTDVIPVLLVAITDSSAEFFENALAKELFTEGNHIANEIGAKFITASAQPHFHRQKEYLKTFFTEVLEKKTVVEDDYKSDRTLESSNETLHQASLPSLTSPSESDDDECQPQYSPTSDEAQLIPSTTPRVKSMDVEGNMNPLTCTNITSQDIERTRKSLPPPKPKPIVERPQVNKLDPKLLEKINDSISKGPVKLQGPPKAPVTLPEDSESTELPPLQDGKIWSMTKLFNRAKLVGPNGDSDDDSPFEQRLRVRQQVKRNHSYRFKSRTLLRKQVYPTDVIRRHAMLSDASDEEQGGSLAGEVRRGRKKKGSDSDPLLSPSECDHLGFDNPAAEFDAETSGNSGTKKKKGAKNKRKDKAKTPKPPKAKTKSVPKVSYFGLPLKDLPLSPTKAVPVFIDKCVDFIEMNGLDTEGLYRVSGNKADQENIQLLFGQDHTVDFRSLGISVHSVTGALKSFFTALPEPLIPYEQQKSLADAVGIENEKDMITALQDVVKKLPQIHYDVFKFIITHLHRVYQHNQNNKMTSENLSICFWPTLMKPNFTDMASITATLVSRTPIQPFILHCPTIFKSRLEPNSFLQPAEGKLIDIEAEPGNL
ncbi:rho GTPase-activating protein 5-like [Petromyzon marinus]|uniref:Rho GTPase-activating protein 5-like n=1 Tax=Petromyzon marinus TaxID=7757 RepID=A0AAJ7X4R1_PETMA|nr:rho GTPase-activating protein 5-like [Petromyzon marinus]